MSPGHQMIWAAAYVRKYEEARADRRRREIQGVDKAEWEIRCAVEAAEWASSTAGAFAGSISEISARCGPMSQPHKEAAEMLLGFLPGHLKIGT